MNTFFQRTPPVVASAFRIMRKELEESVKAFQYLQSDYFHKVLFPKKLRKLNNLFL